MKLSCDIEEKALTNVFLFVTCSICISAHNYIKDIQVSLLRAYISTLKFDVICSSETHLDSDTYDDDSNLKIAGYTLIRADHPSNTKQGGVCIYYINSLTFRLLNIHNLKECMNSEISFAGIIYNFIPLYRSPSQSSDNYKDFAENLELNLDKITNKSPYVLVLHSDFNVKSPNCCKDNKTTYEGYKIDAITSHFGLQQLIKELTHFNRLIFMYWSVIYFSNQPRNGIRSSFLTSLKLSSPNNLCKN